MIRIVTPFQIDIPNKNEDIAWDIVGKNPSISCKVKNTKNDKPMDSVRAENLSPSRKVISSMIGPMRQP